MSSALADPVSESASVAVDAAMSLGVQTPAYLYDLDEVRANCERLRSALPRLNGIYYSLKANPHPAILATVRSQGALPEVCSVGELDQALAAGWPASEVLYTGPGKRDEDVAYALKIGVREFSVDSGMALDQLNRLAEHADVDVRSLLRINDDQPVAGQGLTMTGVPSQFGADLEWVLAEPQRFANRKRVRVSGLHLYMGTNLTNVHDLLGQFAHSLATTARLTEVLAGQGVQIETLDLGGGFGAPFAQKGQAINLEGLHEGLATLFDEHFRTWREGSPHIVFESGRYLVGTAGTLLTRVLDVKKSHGKDVVVLDSGINHLGGMSGLRRLPPLNPYLVGQQQEGPTTPFIVTGPLCTPLDSWSRNAQLPALSSGDVLSVPNVGAYGLYASLIAFLGHPAPTEAVVDGGRVTHLSQLELIRKEYL